MIGMKEKKMKTMKTMKTTKLRSTRSIVNVEGRNHRDESQSPKSPEKKTENGAESCQEEVGVPRKPNRTSCSATVISPTMSHASSMSRLVVTPERAGQIDQPGSVSEKEKQTMECVRIADLSIRVHQQPKVVRLLDRIGAVIVRDDLGFGCASFGHQGL
jgi:hypothetical protein